MEPPLRAEHLMRYQAVRTLKERRAGLQEFFRFNPVCFGAEGFGVERLSGKGFCGSAPLGL